MAHVGEILEQLTDRDVQPDPIDCKCGRACEWAWFDPKNDRLTARWIGPAVSPCNACEKEQDSRDAVRSMANRQHRAGVSARHRPYRWGRVIMAEKGEDGMEFARRVRAYEEAFIGITYDNAEAAKAMKKWRPGRGSLYIEGETGRGKSLFAAATANALLSVNELGSKPMSEDDARPMFFGRRTWDVLMIDEEDLHARVRLSWKNDPVPLARISKVSALIIEDLGTVGREKSGKAKEWVAQNIERLVDHRWRNNLSMLITSNVPFAELGEVYGARVASRLADMCGRAYVVGGPDWRLA